MTPLHQIGEFLRETFGRIPMPVVRGIFLAVPVVLLVWVLLLPRRMTVPPGAAGRWDTNLKLWASLALLLQIIIYAVF